jgi:hypothetical protein
MEFKWTDLGCFTGELARYDSFIKYLPMIRPRVEICWFPDRWSPFEKVSFLKGHSYRCQNDSRQSDVPRLRSSTQACLGTSEMGSPRARL